MKSEHNNRKDQQDQPSYKNLSSQVLGAALVLSLGIAIWLFIISTDQISEPGGGNGPVPPTNTKLEQLIDKLAPELEQSIGESATLTHERVSSNVDAVLDRVYAPVYGAIPAYADFHYSLIGEYLEWAEIIGLAKESVYETLKGYLEDVFEGGEVPEDITRIIAKVFGKDKPTLDDISEYLKGNTTFEEYLAGNKTHEELMEDIKEDLEDDEVPAELEAHIIRIYQQQQATNKLTEILFNGFGQRLDAAMSLLDQQYTAEYERILSEEANKISSQDIVRDALEIALDDATQRAKITTPVAAGSAIANSIALRKVTSSMAVRIAKTTAIRVMLKFVAKKTAAVLIGGGVGTLVCVWMGPAALICGVAGAAIAWFVVDTAAIELDEYFNRDEFEAELRQMIAEDYAQKKSVISEALARKTTEMTEAAPEIAEDFTLRSRQLL